MNYFYTQYAYLFPIFVMILFDSKREIINLIIPYLANYSLTLE